MASKSPKRTITGSRPTSFTSIPTENEELRRIQTNIQTAVEGLDKNALLRHKILEDIELSPDEPDVVQHGLGQCPRGWQIIDRTGPGTVYRISWDSRQITLQADTVVTVSIMVF